MKLSPMEIKPSANADPSQKEVVSLLKGYQYPKNDCRWRKDVEETTQRSHLTDHTTDVEVYLEATSGLSTTSDSRIFLLCGWPSARSRSSSSIRRLRSSSRCCDSSSAMRNRCSESRIVIPARRALASSCSSCVTRSL